MTTTTRPSPGLLPRVGAGAVAGLAGGIVFGVLMAMTGMLATIAAMVGSASPAVGAVVHLVISAGIGALFALIFAPRSLAVTLAAGAGYGVVWWVIGPLVMMPLMMGMSPFTFGPATLPALMGHIIYGLITAGMLVVLRRSMVAGH